jgi:hypothetical protein
MRKMEEQEESVGGERGRLKREKLYEEVKPYVYCIFSNFCFAGYNLISKIYLDKGMSRYVLVAYGHAFGTLATALLAFLFERLINPSLWLFLFCFGLFILNFFGSDQRGKQKTKKKLVAQKLESTSKRACLLHACGFCLLCMPSTRMFA